MAIFYCKTEHISRKTGRSSVAAAAYRSGSRLEDKRTGLEHDFTKKQGVIHTKIFTPHDIKISRNELWDKAENAENRKDARTAREWIIALPNELDQEQQIELTEQFAKDLVNRYGLAVDIAIHAPDRKGDLRNYHAHVLTTTREIHALDNELVLGGKTKLELSDTKLKQLGLEKGSIQIDSVRALWAECINKSLERYGFDERVDHRSYERQGIEKEAQRHEGVKVTQLRRMGIDTEISLSNDAIKERNEQRQLIRGLEQEIIATERLVANLQRDKEQRQKEKPKLSDSEKLQLASKVITQFNSKVNELSRTYAMQYNQEVKEQFNHDLALVQREKTSLEQQIQNLGNRPRLFGAKDWDAKKDRLQADWHRANEKEKELKGELQKRTLDANHFKDKAFNDVSKDNPKARENFDKANAYREKQLQQKEPQKDQDKQAERQARLEQARAIGEAEKANKAQLDKEREQRAEERKQQRMR